MGEFRVLAREQLWQWAKLRQIAQGENERDTGYSCEVAGFKERFVQIMYWEAR